MALSIEESKSPRYTDLATREKILKLHQEGYCQRDIARLVYVSPSTVNLWINRQGKLDALKRTGRPRKTTPEEEDEIYKRSTDEPFLPATDINRKLQLNVSPQTVRNRMAERGLANCKPCLKPFLKDIHKTKRYDFAINYMDYTPKQWERVCFADEKVFQSFGHGSQRVWRPKLNRWDKDKDERTVTRYHATVLTHRKKSGRFSIPVWGCIGSRHELHLIKVKHLKQDYFIQEILERYFRGSEQTIYLLHDKSPIHTAKRVQQWLKQHNVKVLEWPSNSPDLNPIENVWGRMEYKMRNRNPTSREHLWEMVQDAYREIMNDTDYIQKLAQSMPYRLNQVIEAKGHFTRY